MLEKRILGAAVAMLALAWPLTSHADDDLVDVKPSRSVSPTRSPGTRSPGINPDTDVAHEGEVPPGQYAQPRTSTTQTTGAIYETSVAAERPAEPERKPNKAMLITGSAIFLGTYVGSVIVASFSDTNGDDMLFIPLVGPWLDLGQRDCSLGECTAREDWNIVTIIGSGAAQAAGIGIALASFLVGERHPKTEAKVQVLPIGMGRGGAGIGAFGAF